MFSTVLDQLQAMFCPTKSRYPLFSWQQVAFRLLTMVILEENQFCGFYLFFFFFLRDTHPER